MFALFYLLAIFGSIGITEVPMLTLAGLGICLLVVAGLKNMQPIVGEMEASITAGWGALLLVIGVLGDLSARGFSSSILLVFFGVLFGVLMIFAALRMWPKKTIIQKAVSGKF
jgi:small-conductance mechanosensitive channel